MKPANSSENNSAINLIIGTKDPIPRNHYSTFTVKFKSKRIMMFCMEKSINYKTLKNKKKFDL